MNVNHVNCYVGSHSVWYVRKREVWIRKAHPEPVYFFDKNRISEAGVIQVGKGELIGVHVSHDVVVQRVRKGSSTQLLDEVRGPHLKFV